MYRSYCKLVIRFQQLQNDIVNDYLGSHLSPPSIRTEVPQMEDNLPLSVLSLFVWIFMSCTTYIFFFSSRLPHIYLSPSLRLSLHRQEERFLRRRTSKKEDHHQRTRRELRSREYIKKGHHDYYPSPHRVPYTSHDNTCGRVVGTRQGSGMVDDGEKGPRSADDW